MIVLDNFFLIFSLFVGSGTRRGTSLLQFLKIGESYDFDYWASVFDSLVHTNCYILPISENFNWIAKTIPGIHSHSKFTFTGVPGEVIMSNSFGILIELLLEDIFMLYLHFYLRFFFIILFMFILYSLILSCIYVYVYISSDLIFKGKL